MTVTLKQAAEILCRVSFPKRPFQTVELVSGPGIGKSEMVCNMLPGMLKEQYGLPVTVIVLECSGIEPSDGVGFAIPTRIKHPSGDEEIVTTYARPDWMPSGMGASSDMIYVIFLDEWSKTPPDVKKVFAPLINEGRIGSRHIGKNAFVVMASNRAVDKSGDYDELAHLQNRRMQLDIAPSLDDWQAWAIAKGVHPIVVAFAERFPEVVFREAVPEVQGPFCTPRALVRGHDAIVQWQSGIANWVTERLCLEALPMMMLGGWIGAADASTFAAFAKTADELPTLQDIVANPAKAKLPSEKRPDASIILITQLALAADDKRVKAFLQYVSRMPQEFQVAFVAKVYKRPVEVRQALIMTTDYSNWAVQNASIILAASALNVE